MQVTSSIKISFIALITVVLFTGSVIAGEMPLSEVQICTIFEETVFGEGIRYFNGDTLNGWVHSNSQIWLMQSPVFYGPVTTSASTFWQGPGYNPQFWVQPIMNYPEAEFPVNLNELRNAASGADQYFNIPGYQFRMQFIGGQGVVVYAWQLETPFQDSLIYTAAPSFYTVYFFEGPLELTCTDAIQRIDYGIEGRYTIGCSDDIYIAGNLRYTDSDTLTGEVNPATNNCLGIISEVNILVQNNTENGKDNGGNLYPNDPWQSDIIINGALLALNESFSFEDQNDDSTLMGGTLPEWYYSEGTSPDERGMIHLWGSVAQYRKGYVHRSNNGGTGYLKDYHYYTRLYQFPPPLFPTVPVELSFDPMELDFGTVEIGETDSLELSLFMTTMDTVIIEDWEYSGSVFSGAPEQLVYTPVDSGTMTVYFTPTNPVEYNEGLTLNTDAGDYLINLTGTGEGTSVDKGNLSASGYGVVSAYPNPFNSKITIEFSMEYAGTAELVIFDTAGRLVLTSSVKFTSGKNRTSWTPDKNGAGIYFYKLTTGDVHFSGKIVYLK